MTSKEKIEYVWNKVIEKARISPVGVFYVDCNPFIDIDANGGVPDEAPVLISKKEQVEILKKFENDGLTVFLNFDGDNKGAWMVLADADQKDKNISPYSNSRTGTQIGVEKKTGTDLGRGVFYLRGEPIQISTKAGTENNSLRLLKTLLKDPEKEWFKDELLEDWEGRQLYKKDLKEIPRNRVYDAAEKLNSKIQKSVGITDFIIFDTNKFKINPLYFRDL